MQQTTKGKIPTKGCLVFRPMLRKSQGAQRCYGKDARNSQICTHVLLLENEVVFGSQKRKLDMPIGDEHEPHRLDQVTFTCLRVEKRSS